MKGKCQWAGGLYIKVVVITGFTVFDIKTRHCGYVDDLILFVNNTRWLAAGINTVNSFITYYKLFCKH